MRFFAAALLSFTTFASAQTPANNTDQLRFTLIFSRHGVRPPLTANAELNLRSADPWPAWELPLGHLTPHGADAIRRMGAYMRLDLARKGMLSSDGCPVPSTFFLYSDTDERNISSTRNTFTALEPNCDLIYTVARETKSKDPLFSPVPAVFLAPAAEPSLAAMREVLGDPQTSVTAAGNPELMVMAHILAPNPEHPAKKPILETPVELTANALGDPVVTVRGPLFSASSLAEDFLLEYADNKPMKDVAWGRIDEAELQKLMALHVKAFTFSHRTPLFARAQASNLLAHMLDTLQQAYNTPTVEPGKKTGLFTNPQPQLDDVPGAIGPPGTRLVYISGHDSNLTALASLLGVQWTADGVTDDTPPDAQLVFELWENRKSHVTSIRLFYRAQTLDQLRAAAPLTLAQPPTEVSLTPLGCQPATPCPFITFFAAAQKASDPAFVTPELAPMDVVR